MAVSVSGPGAGGVVERRIAAGSDDAEQRVSNGAIDLSSGDLELVFDGTRQQLVGLRFPNLQIPPGRTIQNAWIQFMTDETGGAAGTLTLHTEATANPGTFTSAANNVGARPRSSASVTWAPGAWNVVGEAGTLQRTPALNSVVQEAVNRPGWNAGNAIVFILSGTGTRWAETFEGRAAGAALLHVEFASGG
jgi:hypothetical protein